MRMVIAALAASLALLPASARADTSPLPFGPEVGRTKFCEAVGQTLLAGDFDRLDATAKAAHDLSHRLPGGETELEIFYRGVAQKGCADEDNCHTDDVFDQRKQRLEEWRDRAPADQTPRVALLRFWHVAAWTARGCGFANDVTQAGWQLFGERSRIAANYARGLKPEDDPEATRLLLELARDFSAPPQQIAAIFVVGRDRFPTYFALYGTYANMIEAKWSGRTDLAAPYLHSLLANPGGDTGEVAYSFAAATLLYASDGDDVYNAITGLDWPTVQRAFATRARLYGLQSWSWMTLCYLATVAGDRDAARDAFRKLGGPITYWPKHGTGDFYLRVLPWLMVRDDSPTEGPAQRR